MVLKRERLKRGIGELTMAEYIDRGDLIEKIKTVLSQRKFAENTTSYFVFEVLTVILKGVPTADVVEVKHGEWIDKKFFGVNIMVCSICECMCEVARFENFGYCPNCGAKMDLKEGDEE